MTRGEKKIICYKLFFWGIVIILMPCPFCCNRLCVLISVLIFFCWLNFVIMFSSLNSFVNKFDHESYDEFVGYMNDTYFV